MLSPSFPRRCIPSLALVLLHAALLTRVGAISFAHDPKAITAQDPVVGIDLQLQHARSAVSYANGSVVEGAAVETDASYKALYRRLRNIAFNIEAGRVLASQSVAFYEYTMGILELEGIDDLTDFNTDSDWATPVAETLPNPCDGWLAKPISWFNTRVLQRPSAACFFDQYETDTDVQTLTMLVKRLLEASAPKLAAVGAALPLYCEVAMPTWFYTAYDPNKDRSDPDSPAIDAPPEPATAAGNETVSGIKNWQNPTFEMRWFEPFARKLTAAVHRAGCRGQLDVPLRTSTRPEGVRGLPAGYLALKSANLTGCEAPTTGKAPHQPRCKCSTSLKTPVKGLLYDYSDSYMQLFAARFGGDEALPYVPWSSWTEMGARAMTGSLESLVTIWEAAWQKVKDVITATETDENSADDWQVVLAGDALDTEGAREEITKILSDLLQGKNFKFVDGGIENGDPAFAAAVGAAQHARRFVDADAGCLVEPLAAASASKDEL